MVIRLRISIQNTALALDMLETLSLAVALYRTVAHSSQAFYCAARELRIACPSNFILRSVYTPKPHPPCQSKKFHMRKRGQDGAIIV
ncbi:hypothetical protein CHELA40_12644 [Chelatococcus asaccharovorans]|nr:hypothetical protein CHELA40_12644 [Chelatococcus asaccharovorans]